jgi:hypothetical protein
MTNLIKYSIIVSMGFESFTAKAYDIGVATPLKKVANAVKNEKNLLGKIPTVLGELGKEAVFTPLRAIGSISSWTIKSMIGVLGGTVKLAGSVAMLVPLPLPGIKKKSQVYEILPV